MAVTSVSELLIAQRLRALARFLPAARQGDVHSIHQARVASRRLREALPLVVDGRAGRKLQRKARALTRALGPVRELDVVLQSLESLRASKDVPKAGVACLRVVIVDERRRLHAEMVQRLADWDIEKVRKRALAGAREHDAVTRDGMSAKRAGRLRREAAAARIAVADRHSLRRALRLRNAIDNAAGIYLPDRLHELRIAVKKLRYSLEVARDLRASRAAASIRTLKRAQDLLGRIHDLEVLITRTRAVQGSPDASDLKLSADLDRLVRRLENECRRLHGHYIAALRQRLITLCERIVHPPVRRRASAA
jgi:CHAD domain-containing protein